eukprot:12137385-Ditylum_brightwellii.AAC.1
MAKYLYIIFNELGIAQHGPTMIYKDNTVTIMMANANKLNEWAQEGMVKLAHIRGVANPAGALSKALG